MDNLTPKPDDDEDRIAKEAQPGGEVFDVPEDTSVIDTEDGGAIVRLDDEEAPKAGEDEFYANLAESLPDEVMSKIASDMLDLIERDKKARQRRDEQYAEGLRRTGLGDEAPGGAQFTGASKVVHPLLTEACVDFAARAIKELFPPGGPARDHLPGDQPPTAEKLKKAKRKTSLMNWQLTKQMREFRAELEQLLTQVPMGGAQYLKLTWDAGRRRPVPLFVGIDDVFLPFAATNFYTAERKTHRQYLTRIAFDKKVADGDYRDVELARETMEPDRSEAEKANDRIEGREATGYNEDGLRVVYETACIWEIEDDAEADGPAPYLITIDDATRRVLAIYRNWEQDDETREEMIWMAEFPFVPWRGAYPIGFPQLIGSLSGAATGALRALLDSGHINNFPGTLKLRGGAGGQSETIEPTEIKEVEGGLASDDIRKVVMPLPFNPPSPVLFQLLGFLVDAGKGVVRTTLDDVSDMRADAPVGTTLARIEQGMVVFSAIHGRLHDAMGRVLEILHRLNKMYLDDEDIEKQTGTEMAKRADFTGPLDVQPVSDPNIFSEMQRMAQIQMISQRAALFPQLYNLRKVETLILERTKIPNAKDLLLPEPVPIDTNAANENIAAVMGRPITAFPLQNHLAHLQVHLDFLRSPVLGANPLIAPRFLPVMINHIKEHIALWYVKSMYEKGSDEVGVPLEEIQRQKDHKLHAKLDEVLASLSPEMIAQAESTFEGMMPLLQQAMQLMQQLAPPMPMPMDPAQVQMAEVQRKSAADKTEAQVKQQESQAKLMREEREANESQQRLAIEAEENQIRRAAIDQEQSGDQLREQGEMQRTVIETEARVGMNEQDNQTARDLAAMEIASGERVAVSTGTGINPQP